MDTGEPNHKSSDSKKPRDHRESRRLAAVMFCDIVSYSAKMDQDERAALHCVRRFESLLREVVPQHEGRVVKFLGDGSLTEFPTAADAVQCARHVLERIASGNSDDEPFQVRIGIDLGEILDRGGDIFGETVNIAARVQNVASPDTIALSERVYAQVRNRMDLPGHLRQPTRLKNIADPIRVFILGGPSSLFARFRLQRNPRRQIRIAAALTFMLATVLLLAWKWPFVTTYWSILTGQPQPNQVGLMWVETDPQADAQVLAAELAEDIDFAMAQRLKQHWIDRYSMQSIFRSVGVDDISQVEQLQVHACNAAKDGGIAYAMACKLKNRPGDAEPWELQTILICTRTRTVVTAYSVSGTTPDELTQRMGSPLEDVIPSLF